MSISLTIDLKESGGQRDPRFPEHYFNAYGLPSVAADLDRLITAPGIRPFSDFIYDGNMLCDEEYAEMGLERPERAWFEPVEGLRTVRQLISHLEERSPVERFESRTIGDLLEELRIVEAILRRAEESREPFSFEVG